MIERERLRAALVDIAAGGGWQGRYAQAALDATSEMPPCEQRAGLVGDDLRAYARAIREEMCRQGVDVSRADGA